MHDGTTCQTRLSDGQVGKCIPLVEICPDMSGEYGKEKNSPADVSSRSPPNSLLIKNVAHCDGADNLSGPVDEVVHRPSADIE